MFSRGIPGWSVLPSDRRAALLQRALARRPFAPLTILMSDGEEITVHNSEVASVLSRGGFLYLDLPEETEPCFLNLLEVKEVRTEGPSLERK